MSADDLQVNQLRAIVGELVDVVETVTRAFGERSGHDTTRTEARLASLRERVAKVGHDG